MDFRLLRHRGRRDPHAIIFACRNRSVRFTIRMLDDRSSPAPPSAPPARRRSPGFLRVIATVLSAFIGIRKRDSAKPPHQAIKPAHIIVAGIHRGAVLHRDPCNRGPFYHQADDRRDSAPGRPRGDRVPRAGPKTSARAT
jgi:hypothetical protein